jgi:very-short-patch-repair endonuclease
MNTEFSFQHEVVSPPFSSCAFCRVQMGEHGGGKMPRSQRSDPKTKHNAIKLRKELTPAERKLWARLRNDQLGVTFRRQHAIGNYIPDFCSPKAKLIIELDGSQHLEQEEYDQERTEYLEEQGYKVTPKGDDVRFWNNDVMKDIEGVILAIMRALKGE